MSTIQRFSPFMAPAAVLLSLALLRTLTLLTRYNKGETRGPFVILILVHYQGWKIHSNGGRSMQLDSVREDLKRLLEYLKYRHGDTTTTWYILSDFECMYKDYTGKEQLLTRCGRPDRETILRTVEEATKNGGSGLIHYGGHCHYTAPGTSRLKKQGAFSIYTETEDCQRGEKLHTLFAVMEKGFMGMSSSPAYHIRPIPEEFLPLRWCLTPARQNVSLLIF